MEFQLLVFMYMNCGNDGAVTSQTLSFASYGLAEEAVARLKKQSPKGAVYLEIFRCYQEGYMEVRD